MLVLTRNLNEPIVIGDNIFVKVVKGNQGQFKIIVDAPRDIRVIRGELYPGMEEVEARWAASLKKMKAKK